MCMYKQWCIWNMKSLLACMFGYMCAQSCKTECGCPYVCLWEKERDSGGREGVCHLENRWRIVLASAQWSDSWTYQLTVRMCAFVHTCTHKGANGPLWACLSCPSEIDFHYGVNEPNKLIAINWRPQLMDCQWEKAEFPQGARSTNNFLTHKAICSFGWNNLPNSIW